MKLLITLILLFTLFNGYINADNTKLSKCGAAWAVPTKSQNPKPTCINVESSIIPRASLSQAAFEAGIRCGQCFELTGPSGKTVVQVGDTCNSGNACTQTDLFHFIIPNDEFNKIGNASAYGNIFSLGFQIVSCDYVGNIKAIFSGPDATPSIYNYFFSVIFTNANVAIKSVSIKGSSMTQFEKLTVQNGNWKWNKDKFELTFPATLIVVGNTGESFRYTLNSKPSAGVPIDIGSQISPKSIASLENSECNMAVLPEFIFDNELSFGWATYQSFNYDGQINTEDSDSPSSNNKYISAKLQDHGGIRFTREGDFQTTYLEKLVFDVKSSVPTDSFAVYFGDLAKSNINQTIGTTWTTIELSVKDLTTDVVAKALTFFNNQATPITLYLDNIKWVFTSDAPVNEPSINIIEVNNKASSTSGGGATTSGKPTSSGTGSGSIDDNSSLTDLSHSEDKEGNSGNHPKGDSNSSNFILPSSIIFILITILSSLLLL